MYEALQVSGRNRSPDAREDPDGPPRPGLERFQPCMFLTRPPGQMAQLANSSWSVPTTGDSSDKFSRGATCENTGTAGFKSLAACAAGRELKLTGRRMLRSLHPCYAPLQPAVGEMRFVFVNLVL